MRLAYLDEAGLAHPKQEPFLVVAAVVVDGDRQWQEVDAYLGAVANEEVPHRPPGFVFHATELFSGGKFFNRDDWPREKRWAILERLVCIPSRFQVPILATSVHRENYVERTLKRYVPDAGPTAEKTVHGIAVCDCLTLINAWMRFAAPNENAVVVAENTDRVKQLTKIAVDVLRSPEKLRHAGISGVRGVPLTHIIDTVHYARKSEASLLQVADLCAFFIKRHCQSKTDSASFYEVLEPRIMFHERYPTDPSQARHDKHAGQ